MSRRRKRQPEVVTKLDGAERQIRAAIRLFFEDEDLLPVVTLARAAAEVLRDIGAREGIDDVVLDSDIVAEGREEEWRRLVRRDQNFLKHADRDPDGTLEFNADSVPFVVFAAVQMLWRVGKCDVPETRAFIGWFVNAYPELIKIEFRDDPRSKVQGNWSHDAVVAGIAALRQLEKIGEWPPDPELVKDQKSYLEYLYDKGIRIVDGRLTRRPTYRLQLPNFGSATRSANELLRRQEEDE